MKKINKMDTERIVAIDSGAWGAMDDLNLYQDMKDFIYGCMKMQKPGKKAMYNGRRFAIDETLEMDDEVHSVKFMQAYIACGLYELEHQALEEKVEEEITYWIYKFKQGIFRHNIPDIAIMEKDVAKIETMITLRFKDLDCYEEEEIITYQEHKEDVYSVMKDYELDMCSGSSYVFFEVFDLDDLFVAQEYIACGLFELEHHYLEPHIEKLMTYWVYQFKHGVFDHVVPDLDVMRADIETIETLTTLKFEDWLIYDGKDMPYQYRRDYVNEWMTAQLAINPNTCRSEPVYSSMSEGDVLKICQYYITCGLFELRYTRLEPTVEDNMVYGIYLFKKGVFDNFVPDLDLMKADVEKIEAMLDYKIDDIDWDEDYYED